MSRTTSLCLSLTSCLLLPVQAQTLKTEIAASQTASTVQVLYVIDGSTLTTYNVNSQTLNASAVGTLTLPETNSASITPSPNDHFVYYSAFDSGSLLNKHLWIYATDATGSPQGPPVQELNAIKFYGAPAFDPKANFLYQITAAPAEGDEYENYTIWRYLLNSTTGRITYPVAEAKYKLPSGAGGSEGCALSIVGFNAAGNKMYDEISCGYPGGASATFNERTVNLETGALGSDVEVYGWNNSSGGGENVQFANNLVFDLVTINDYQQGSNSVNIYPVQPNASATPLVECTAAMLEACGYFSGLNLVDPSGKYVFLAISSGTTQIEKVEIGEHKIVDTSSYIPYTVEQLSPDGSIAYAVQESYPGLTLEIYGFNLATGAVTPGGAIGIPSAIDPWFTAERY
jgi:hypothetical protein